jgi:hypothetical protein
MSITGTRKSMCAGQALRPMGAKNDEFVTDACAAGRI